MKINCFLTENQRFEQDFRKSLVFQRKTDIGEEPKGQKKQAEEKKCDRGAPNFQKWCFRLTFFSTFLG